jgi:peptide/nickel transport system substrate-binding protein
MKRSLILAHGLALVALLAACSPPTPSTVVETVEVQVEQTVEVVVTQIVEGETVIVTATPAPVEATAEPEAEPTPEPVTGGTIIFAASSDASLFDPKFTNDNYSLYAQGQVYATLLQNSPDGTELRPWLAESWEANDDASEFTFNLRENAGFCDGTPITAEDVKFSFDRALEEDSSVSWQYPSSPQVEVVDDHTVKIILERSNVAFPSYLTLWGTHIVSKAYVEANDPETVAEQPLGSGPFCVDRWDKGQVLVFTRNPNYWDVEHVYPDTVELRVIADDTARVLQLQTGDIDVALDVPYSQVGALQSFPGVNVHVRPLYGLAAIALNQHTVEEFKDLKVRQAMSWAIDRQAMVDALLFGQGEPAMSVFYGRNILYWNGDYGYTFDLEKAQQLMAESSAPDGFDVDLVTIAGDTLSQQTGVILKDQLSKIGININITPVEPGSWFDVWSAGEFEMLYKLGTNDVIDPAENIPFDFWSFDEGGSDGAFSGYHNDELVRLSMEAEAETDPEARADLYRQFQQIAMEDAGQLWLFYPSNRWATRDNIYGFSLFDTGLRRFWEAWKVQ